MGEREREASLMPCTPAFLAQLIQEAFTMAQIPASCHKPPLCMGVFEIVNPYVLNWT